MEKSTYHNANKSYETISTVKMSNVIEPFPVRNEREEKHTFLFSGSSEGVYVHASTSQPFGHVIPCSICAHLSCIAQDRAKYRCIVVVVFCLNVM